MNQTEVSAQLMPATPVPGAHTGLAREGAGSPAEGRRRTPWGSTWQGPAFSAVILYI